MYLCIMILNLSLEELENLRWFQHREENDHFAATPCIIVFYFFILFNCSHIVATTEYFESTRRYCYPKCALAFLGFKSTKK